MQHGGSTSGLGHGSGGTQPLWVPTLLPEVGIIPAGLGRSWAARQRGAADCGCPGGTPAPSPQLVAMVSPVLTPDGQQQPREQHVTPFRGQPGLVLQHPRKGTRVPAGSLAQQPGPPPVMRMVASPPHCPPVLSHPPTTFHFLFCSERHTQQRFFFVPIPKTFRLQVQLLQLQLVTSGVSSLLQLHDWAPLGLLAP